MEPRAGAKRRRNNQANDNSEDAKQRRKLVDQKLKLWSHGGGIPIPDWRVWKDGGCSLMETMSIFAVKSLLVEISTNCKLLPYFGRIWSKLQEVRRDRVYGPFGQFTVPEQIRCCLDKKEGDELTLAVRNALAQGGPPPLDDSDEEKMIGANADLMPVEVARVLDTQRRSDLVDKIKSLLEIKSYPTVPYDGDDDEFIKEHEGLVPKKLAEFLNKEDRRQLVTLVQNSPRVLKNWYTFIEALPDDEARELFSEETKNLFQGNNAKHARFRREVKSDPKLDLLFFKEAEENGCLKLVRSEVFAELERHQRRDLAKEILKCPDPDTKEEMMLEFKRRNVKEAFHIDECLDVLPLKESVFLNHKLRLFVAKRLRRRKEVAAAAEDDKACNDADNDNLIPEWLVGLLMPEELSDVIKKLMNREEFEEWKTTGKINRKPKNGTANDDNIE